LGLITFIHLVYGTHFAAFVFTFPTISVLFTIHNISSRRATTSAVAIGLLTVFTLYLSSLIPQPRPYPFNPQDTRYPEIFIALLITAASFRWIRAEHDRVAAHLDHQHKLATTRAQQLKMLVWALSHDLANPLSVIHYSAEKGRKAASALASEPIASDFARISMAATKQRELIAHIRKVAELAERSKEPALVPVDLAHAIAQARESVEDKLKHKSLTLNVRLPVGSPLAIMAEPVGLSSMVFTNLLTNAIKFSHEGGTITIAARTYSSDGRSLIDISIEDGGTGMDAERASKLFENVINHSEKGTQGEEGTGFGIAIVQSHLQMYRATARVESAEISSPVNGWHGTRVTITVAAAS
jgi:signal transduction histidine kinase